MIQIEPVGNLRSQWGEGPVWWRGVLYYVDIEGHLVHCYDPADGSEKSWDVGERVGTSQQDGLRRGFGHADDLDGVQMNAGVLSAVRYGRCERSRQPKVERKSNEIIGCCCAAASIGRSFSA